MTREKFLKKFQDVLQRIEPLSMEAALDDLEEWDSLSMMATAAFFKTDFQKEISPDSMKEFVRVQDLWTFAQN